MCEKKDKNKEIKKVRTVKNEEKEEEIRHGGKGNIHTQKNAWSSLFLYFLYCVFSLCQFSC